MNPISLWSFPGIRIEPQISYRGEVSDFALEMDLKNPFYTFWSLESGGLTLSWRSTSRVIQPGESVLIPPNLRRKHQFLSGSKIVSFSFRAEWGDGRSLLSFQDPLFAGSAAALRLRQSAWKAIRALRSGDVRVAEGGGAPDLWLEIRSVLDLAVSRIFRWAHAEGAVWNLHQTGDLRLDKVLADLSQNPAAGPLPYPRWKSQSGLSRVHLNRLALLKTGESLHARRNSLLLAEICRSISDGNESFKELAARLNFYDASHFTRWVSSQTGKSPGRLREVWAGGSAAS